MHTEALWHCCFSPETTQHWHNRLKSMSSSVTLRLGSDKKNNELVFWTSWLRAVWTSQETNKTEKSNHLDLLSFVFFLPFFYNFVLSRRGDPWVSLMLEEGSTGYQHCIATDYFSPQVIMTIWINILLSYHCADLQTEGNNSSTCSAISLLRHFTEFCLLMLLLFLFSSPFPQLWKCHKPLFLQ